MVCASVLTRRPISLLGEIRARDFDGGTVSEWGKPGAHRAFLIWAGFGPQPFFAYAPLRIRHSIPSGAALDCNCGL
jgi:hypothetical protein